MQLSLDHRLNLAALLSHTFTTHIQYVRAQSLLAALGDDPVPVDDDTSLVAHAQLCAQLAVQLEGLDMAAMAHAWKSFARLAQRHAARLRGSLDVATPIAQLAQGVCATLANLRALREPDKKAGNAVKVNIYTLSLGGLKRMSCERFSFIGSCIRRGIESK